MDFFAVFEEMDGAEQDSTRRKGDRRYIVAGEDGNPLRFIGIPRLAMVSPVRSPDEKKREDYVEREYTTFPMESWTQKPESQNTSRRPLFREDDL